jgi:hypothetical protein
VCSGTNCWQVMIGTPLAIDMRRSMMDIMAPCAGSHLGCEFSATRLGQRAISYGSMQYQAMPQIYGDWDRTIHLIKKLEFVF